MKNIDKIVIDTNVWIYYLNSKSQLHKKTRDKISEFLSDGIELYITNQIIRETLVVLTRPNLTEKPVTPSGAIAKIREITTYLSVLFESEKSKEVLMELIENHEVKGKNIHDANIVAVMKANKIEAICTNNPADFKRFDDIKIFGL